jgi:hypothetical protein
LSYSRKLKKFTQPTYATVAREIDTALVNLTADEQAQEIKQLKS